jgi:hypothetical protein
MVRLHEEQFDHGPVQAGAHFSDPDALVCVREEGAERHRCDGAMG